MEHYIYIIGMGCRNPGIFGRGCPLLLAVLLLSVAEAGAQTDSLYLDAATHTEARKQAVAIPSSSGVVMDLSGMRTLPQLLGSSDPLNFAQDLPSMSAQTELEAGLHIQGNDHSHNLVSSGGVPVYGVNHLLGIFSVFNPSHYSRMDYKTWAPGMNRLGGSIDMPLPDTLVRKVGLDASAGLLAAQGTLRVPLGERAFVEASARKSYINLLYGDFLTWGQGTGFDNTAMRYGFTDLNLTGMLVAGERDRLWLDAYWGGDDVSGMTGLFDVDLSSSWNNGMAALHWQHGSLLQSAYYTGFGLTLSGYWTGQKAEVDSYLRTFGYNASLGLGDFTLSFKTALHRAMPQNPSVVGTVNTSLMQQELQQGWENSLWAAWKKEFGPLSICASLQGSLYLSPEKVWFPGLDPSLELQWNLYRAGRITARYGFSRQFLFQTGVSDVGLPSEFWFLAGKYSEPQTARGGSLSYLLDFGHGVYTLSAEAYYRTLGGQVEYRGSLLDFVDTSYSLDDVLLHGKGRAFGVNLSLNKVSGALTGWISYAWGRSLRTFGDMPESPAAHERIHELDAVLSYNLGRWSFGGTLVAASGTPYTAPEYLYMISQKVIAWYGPHNGSRLKPYFRGDVSVNYFFNKSPRLENGLNFSIYNVTGRGNELYTRLWVNLEEELLGLPGPHILLTHTPFGTGQRGRVRIP